MPDSPVHPTAVRLPEVQNAILGVLEQRAVRQGGTIRLADVLVAMDARGYSSRWTKRALDALVEAGRLRESRATLIEVVSTDPIAEERRRRKPGQGRSRFRPASL